MKYVCQLTGLSPPAKYLSHDALHGEKYVSPSAPHTGSKMVEEQLQSVLQEARSTSFTAVTLLYL